MANVLFNSAAPSDEEGQGPSGAGPAPSAPSSPYYTPSAPNNSLTDRIAGYYNAGTNNLYRPSVADVSQWGTDIDPMYEARIRQAIQLWSHDWLAKHQSAPGTTGQTTGTTGTGGTTPTNWPPDLDPRIAALYTRYGVQPGGRGSGATDYQYWQTDGLRNASGDWGYVLWRIEDELQGKTRPPETGGTGLGTTGGGSSRAPFQPLASTASGSYNDAVQIIKDRYQQYYGKPISDAALNTVLQHYGITASTAGTAGGPGALLTSQRLGAGAYGTAQQAVDYLNEQSMRIRGRPITDAEAEQAAQIIGYQPGQQVTGTQVNQILDVLDRDASVRGPNTAGTAGTARTYTAADINPILQALYNNTASGWDTGSTGGPNVNSGQNNPGGYTDASSQIYLGQLMQRLLELRTPQNDPMENLLALAGMQRVGDLTSATPYTAGEDAALTAKYMNPLTRARDAALLRNKEQISARGMGDTSGLLHVLDRQTQNDYQHGVAGASNDLAVRAVDEKQRRQDEALTILNSLMQLSRSRTDRQNALYDQALSVAKGFPDFDEQRLRDLLASSGEGVSSTGALGSISSLGSLGLGSTINNQNQSGNSAAAWGQLIGYLLPLITRAA
jgi:hypothetical protein